MVGKIKFLLLLNIPINIYLIFNCIDSIDRFYFIMLNGLLTPVFLIIFVIREHRKTIIIELISLLVIITIYSTAFLMGASFIESLKLIN